MPDINLNDIPMDVLNINLSSPSAPAEYAWQLARGFTPLNLDLVRRMLRLRRKRGFNAVLEGAFEAPKWLHNIHPEPLEPIEDVASSAEKAVKNIKGKVTKTIKTPIKKLNIKETVITKAPSLLESASLLSPFALPATVSGLGALLLARELSRGKEAAKLTEYALSSRKGLKAVKRLAKTRGIARPSGLMTLLGLATLGAGGSALYNKITGTPGKNLSYLLRSLFKKKKTT